MPSDAFYGALGLVASVFVLYQGIRGRPLSRGIAQHVPETLLRTLTPVGGAAGLVWSIGLLTGVGLLAMIGLVAFLALVVVLLVAEAAHWVGDQVSDEDPDQSHE
ncbi:MAG: hypothetical protein WD770_06535 [Actinomycetota bacterium]